MNLILIVLCALLPLVTADAVNDQCAKLCNASDVCCIAKCYKVPCPDATQVEESNKCAAACPQGNGSTGDTQKYADCLQKCFDHYYIGTDGVTPAIVPVDTSSSGTIVHSTTVSGTTVSGTTMTVPGFTVSGTTEHDTTVHGTTASGTTVTVPGVIVSGTTVHDTTVPETTVTGVHTTQTDATAQSGSSKATSTADGSAISGSSSTNANAMATHVSNAVANVNMGALSVGISGLVLAALAL
ncbi:hypothetical protein N7520_011971 [Penicillium odoratum]|uniref:uncharacterized protein n=1 Tax=Penicillium odoratum TaxID=1167516 RepID=UPI002547B9C6|nr:uncharacterized protein N7520_011971 [Penicillium odoratum]KAJ5746789.1 hypothetical protein N7520_011971 [Penicillium odoratum]